MDCLICITRSYYSFMLFSLDLVNKISEDPKSDSPDNTLSKNTFNVKFLCAVKHLKPFKDKCRSGRHDRLLILKLWACNDQWNVSRHKSHGALDGKKSQIPKRPL